MSRLSSIFIAVATVIFTLCLQQRPLRGDDAETFLLRYQFKKGQVVRYEDSLRDDYIIQLGESTEKQYSYQKSEKNYRVISVNKDGSAELELMFDWVVIDLSQNGVTAHFDSRIDEKPAPLFEPMAAIVGKPRLRITVSPTGDISNVQSLLAKQKAPGKSTFDDFPKLPEKPVKVGGHWKEDVAVPLRFSANSKLKQTVKLQRRYFVRSLKDGIVDISVKTKVLTPVTSPELQLQLIRRQPQGSFQMNLKTGMFLSRTLTQDNRVLNFGNGASQMDFTHLHTEKMLPMVVAELSDDSATR